MIRLVGTVNGWAATWEVPHGSLLPVREEPVKVPTDEVVESVKPGDSVWLVADWLVVESVDATPRLERDATWTELQSLRSAIKSALEGDSNDAEHDALVEAAGYFGVEWTSFEDREEES